MKFFLSLLDKFGQAVLKLKTNNALRRTTQKDGRQFTAIGNLSNSKELKITVVARFYTCASNTLDKQDWYSLW